MGKANKNRIYWPRCSVCQYMKKHKDFRYACIHSTYQDPKGVESLVQVNERYGNPFLMPTLYRHMQRHHKANKSFYTQEKGEKYEKRSALIGADPNTLELNNTKELLENTVNVVESDVMSKQQHELGLDEFIAIGRDRLAHGEMALSASNFITAIKVKAEIERTTKDRRLEMLKSMFAGAAPKQNNENNS